jgi:hypothetical protein
VAGNPEFLLKLHNHRIRVGTAGGSVAARPIARHPKVTKPRKLSPSVTPNPEWSRGTGEQ